MKLSQILDDIHTGDGLLNDLDAAARSRANQTRMRQNETPAYREGRSEPLLPPIKAKTNITQEVIKEMPTEISVSDEQLEKQKDAIVADYAILEPQEFLRKYQIGGTRWRKLKMRWNIPTKPRPNNWPNKKLSKATAKLPEKLPEPSTCAKTQTDTIPIDQVKQMLSDIEKRLATLDLSVGDLLNRGYIDESIKVDIVAAAIEYYSSFTKEERGKKILVIVQALENI
jgi:hypothetical protein